MGVLRQPSVEGRIDYRVVRKQSTICIQVQTVHPPTVII